jgi:hypothetical protein
MAVRSSSGPFKSWFGGYEWVQDELPTFTANKLEDYKLDFELEAIAASPHSVSNVSMRQVPSGKYSDATGVTQQQFQSQLQRAWDFTRKIEKDLVTITNSYPGLIPTLLSISLDGFSCHVHQIDAFLKRVPSFIWIVQETELTYGMNERFFPWVASGLSYSKFSTRSLRVRFAAL